VADQPYPTLTTLTLTDTERCVAARALNMTAVMLDALGTPDDRLMAGTALELAARICPEEHLV
jgi:hypothetical protein